MIEFKISLPGCENYCITVDVKDIAEAVTAKGKGYSLLLIKELLKHWEMTSYIDVIKLDEIKDLVNSKLEIEDYGEQRKNMCS